VTGPDQLPAVERLGGGQLLVRGLAVLRLHRWATAAVAIARRRDGMGTLDPDARELLAALEAEARAAVSTAQDAEARAGMSAGPQRDIRRRADVQPSPQDDLMISTEEARQLLGLSPRHVRRLAPQLDGRQVAGRWLFPRSAVLERKTA
jgi:hypothetical protein